MVFGTFDILHPGHANLFKQARALAAQPFLIVSVARDKNVRRIKGRRPLYNERQRLAKLRQHELVDKAVLGGIKDHLTHIAREKPEIIALGYDQKAYVRGLKTALLDRGVTVKILRLKPYYPHKYKSSLLKSSP
jgi:FAD synthetase